MLEIPEFGKDSETRGHRQLQSKFDAILGYMRPCLREEKDGTLAYHPHDIICCSYLLSKAASQVSLRKQPVRPVTDGGTNRVPYKVPRQ